MPKKNETTSELKITAERPVTKLSLDTYAPSRAVRNISIPIKKITKRELQSILTLPKPVGSIESHLDMAKAAMDKELMPSPDRTSPVSRG